MTNEGESNGRHKDGRQIPGKGHRLGWVSNELWQEMKAQAQAQGVTVTDFVIAAIEAALADNDVKALFLAYREARNEMDYILLDRPDNGIAVDNDELAQKWQHYNRICGELENKILS